MPTMGSVRLLIRRKPRNLADDARQSPEYYERVCRDLRDPEVRSSPRRRAVAGRSIVTVAHDSPFAGPLVTLPFPPRPRHRRLKDNDVKNLREASSSPMARGNGSQREGRAGDMPEKRSILLM